MEAGGPDPKEYRGLPRHFPSEVGVEGGDYDYQSPLE